MYRIKVHGKCAVSDSQQKENAAYAVGLGVPLIQKQPPHGRPLAVVGGGPSIKDYLKCIQRWNGDIWSINATWKWLKEHGVDSTFFSVDPLEAAAEMAVGVQKGIVASGCHKRMFTAIPELQMFHTDQITANGLIGGTTTATRAPTLALMMGYGSVTFFGCESSYGEVSHAYRSEEEPDQVLVKAGEGIYRTSLPLLDQAENLAVILREFPDIFHDRSGGLLSAMVKHWDTWEVVALSTYLKEILDPA